jgi:solute carrier family 45 protein 1/2/4
MTCTLFVDSVTAATVITVLCGIPWAVAMWVPFSLLGEIISQKQLDLILDDDASVVDELNNNNNSLNNEDFEILNPKLQLDAGFVLGIVIFF